MNNLRKREIQFLWFLAFIFHGNKIVSQCCFNCFTVFKKLILFNFNTGEHYLALSIITNLQPSQGWQRMKKQETFVQHMEITGENIVLVYVALPLIC